MTDLEINRDIRPQHEQEFVKRFGHLSCSLKAIRKRVNPH